MSNKIKEVDQGCDERLRPLSFPRVTSPIHQLVLCARVVQSDGGPEFATAIMELANALDLYLSIEDAKSSGSSSTHLLIRIRELCARVVNTPGAEFDTAIAELASALELSETNQNKEDGNRPKLP